MAYSYNMDRSDVVFASMGDINASFKDLCAVCDSIRYRNVSSAMKVLDDVISAGAAIRYRRHNRYMGSRHELGGRVGRFPIKCASIVQKVLTNAAANARNKGYDPESMFVIHAAANKTTVFPRAPPRGARAVVVGGYGYSSMRRSNLEFARVEIGLSSKTEGKLGKDKLRLVKMFNIPRKQPAKMPTGKPAPAKKPEAKKAEAPKAAAQAKV